MAGVGGGAVIVGVSGHRRRLAARMGCGGRLVPVDGGSRLARMPGAQQHLGHRPPEGEQRGQDQQHQDAQTFHGGELSTAPWRGTCLAADAVARAVNAA